MKGGRIVSIYALALAAGIFLQFDRMEAWLASAFPDGAPAAVAALVKAGEAVHSGTGLTALGLSLDCSAAGLFEGSYKKTYRCQDVLLAGARPSDSGFPGEAHAQAPVPGTRDGASAAGNGASAGEGDAATPSVFVPSVPAPGDVLTPSIPAGAGAPARPPAGERPQAAPKLAVKLAPPLNVLVVGDSLAIALAVSLEKALKEFEGLSLTARGKIASGLFNPQYYNWEQALSQFIDENGAKLVVVMMGANDAKYLSLDPASPEPVALADKRRFVYEARLKKFLAVMDQKGVSSYWIGLPVMGDPDLAAKSRALNSMVREGCDGSSRARFLDTWDLLCGPEGGYAQHLTTPAGHRVRVREGDKVHFSVAGGDIIVKALLRDAEQTVELRPRGSKEVAEAGLGHPPSAR
jgi:hypothetical protein